MINKCINIIMGLRELFDDNSRWNESIKRRLGSCGENVYIGNNTIFTNPGAVHLGDRVRIDPLSLITTGLEVGNNVQICSHTVLGGGGQHTIHLGDWTFIGYGSKLFCASEDYSGKHGPVNEYWGSNKIHRGDITFGDYSGVASDVVVMPGIELPEGCRIGAKSFVYSDENLREYSIFLYKNNKLEYHNAVDRDSMLNSVESPGFLKEY